MYRLMPYLHILRNSSGSNYKENACKTTVFRDRHSPSLLHFSFHQGLNATRFQSLGRIPWERERERDEGSLVFTMFSVRLLLHVPMTLPLFEQTIKFKSCTLVKQCHSMQCNAPWHPRTIALEPQKVLRNSSLKVPIPSLLNPRRLPTYSLQSPQSTNPFPESANPFPPQPP